MPSALAQAAGIKLTIPAESAFDGNAEPNPHIKPIGKE